MTNKEAIKVLNCSSLQTFCLCKVAIDGKMLSMKEALGMGIEALENQNSVIEELEKLKAEIENMWIKSAKDLRTGGVIYENLCEHSEVLEIIDKHIAEIKGETE